MGIWWLFLSLRFYGHFPDEPGLAGVYWSKGWLKWWWQLEVMDVQSNHHHQQTNTHIFLQARCPSCRPTNSVKALMGWLLLLNIIRRVAHFSVWQLIFLFDTPSRPLEFRRRELLRYKGLDVLACKAILFLCMVEILARHLSWWDKWPGNRTWTHVNHWASDVPW